MLYKVCCPYVYARTVDVFIKLSAELIVNAKNIRISAVLEQELGEPRVPTAPPLPTPKPSKPGRI